MDVIRKISLAAVLLSAMAFSASAAKIDVNDPFPQPLNGSPSLAKCDQGGSAGTVCSKWEDGLADGNYIPAFTVTFLDAFSATWSFVAANVTGVALADVLFPKYIAVKGSNDFLVIDVTGTTSGTVSTLGLFNNGGNQPAISHISFYDTGVPPAVPLPAAGWLMLAGFGGLAALRRRRKAA